MTGWVKLHRSLLDWEWYRDTNTKTVFLHLLLLANHGEGSYKGFALRAGQLISSVTEISEATGLTVRQTRTALSHLKTTSEVTIKTTNKFSVITLVNWALYQSDNDNATSNAASNRANERQAKATKTTRLVKEEVTKNKKSLSSEPPTADSNGESSLCESSNKRKRVYEHAGIYYKSAAWLAKRIENRVSGYKKHTEATLQAWADSARLMIEVDKRDANLAKILIRFSQEDEFWSGNILSMPKFRKQFDQLNVRYQEQCRRNKTTVTDNAGDGYANAADVLRAMEEGGE